MRISTSVVVLLFLTCGSVEAAVPIEVRGVLWNSRDKGNLPANVMKPLRPCHILIFNAGSDTIVLPRSVGAWGVNIGNSMSFVDAATPEYPGDYVQIRPRHAHAMYFAISESRGLERAWLHFSMDVHHKGKWHECQVAYPLYKASTTKGRVTMKEGVAPKGADRPTSPAKPGPSASNAPSPASASNPSPTPPPSTSLQRDLGC